MKNTTNTQTTDSSLGVTQIGTSYARACIILLALNFCLTGYVMLNVMDIQSATYDQSVQTTRTSASTPTDNKATLGTLEAIGDDPSLTLPAPAEERVTRPE
jgi:hypothetical protein